MYFSTTIISVICIFFYRLSSAKRASTPLASSFSKARLVSIGVAAFFGVIGTFLLYTALSKGDASKIYPLAGLQSIFIFIIASIFLREKFKWQRLIGIIVVFAGIFLLSM
jgi:transporter family protein